MRSNPVLTPMTPQGKLKSIIAVCVEKCCLLFRHWIDICWCILVSDRLVAKNVDRPSLQMEICIGKINQNHVKGPIDLKMKQFSKQHLIKRKESF